MSLPIKTLVQCDFDGTITEEDIALFLMDTFVGEGWRPLLDDYRQHKISVGQFNTRAFAMIKADRETLLAAIRGKVRLREGLQQLVACCQRRGFRLVIVSNGLDFYIETILKDAGLDGIEVHAAQTRFSPRGLEVRYLGPDGHEMDSNFKDAYARLFQGQGYRLVYIGDGLSDVEASRYAHHVLATGEFLDYCMKNNLSCKPFDNLTDVVASLELL